MEMDSLVEIVLMVAVMLHEVKDIKVIIVYNLIFKYFRHDYLL